MKKVLHVFYMHCYLDFFFTVQQLSLSLKTNMEFVR